MTNIFIGVDPGVTGAIAFYRPKPYALAVFDMPTRVRASGRKEVDAMALATTIGDFTSGHSTIAVIEKVAAMTGKESAASSFQFGRSFGIVLGVLAGFGVTTIETRPAVWKAMMGLGRDKNDSLVKARQLFPRSKRFVLQKHNGRAEAALLAHMGENALSSLVSGTNMIGGQSD